LQREGLGVVTVFNRPAALVFLVGAGLLVFFACANVDVRGGDDGADQRRAGPAPAGRAAEPADGSRRGLGELGHGLRLGRQRRLGGSAARAAEADKLKQ
jgi:hypothetical protein